MSSTKFDALASLSFLVQIVLAEAAAGHDPPLPWPNLAAVSTNRASTSGRVDRVTRRR